LQRQTTQLPEPARQQAAGQRAAGQPAASNANLVTQASFASLSLPTAQVVQLLEAEEGPAAASPEQSSSEQGAAEAGAEINVDELTRRVYQEIKRRLSTEWERMRRKF